MTTVTDIQFIGNEVGLKWSDDTESFIPMDRLRELSPSAETQGERDLLGQAISADEKGKDFSGVTVTGWAAVGGYAIQFSFSDGHKTGLYTYEYLSEITAS